VKISTFDAVQNGGSRLRPASERSCGRPGPGHVGPETAVLARRPILLAIPR